MKSADSHGMSINQYCIQILESHLHAPAQFPSRDEFPKTFKKRVVALLLFGSGARGKLTSESDLDWLLILRSGDKPDRTLYREWESWADEIKLNQRYGRVVNPHFVSLPRKVDEAGSIWFEVALDHRLYWEDPDESVSRFLQDLRVKILAGEFQRKISQSQPYWVRKK